MRCEKELEKKIPKILPDLEGISAIISSYRPTYEALVSKKTGIRSIIHDELICHLQKMLRLFRDNIEL